MARKRYIRPASKAVPPGSRPTRYTGPNGLWSLLLVNRDFKNAHAVKVRFDTTNGKAWFSGDVTQTQFGPAQYAWIEKGKDSHPRSR